MVVAPLTVPVMSELAEGPKSLVNCSLPVTPEPAPIPTTPAPTRLMLVSDVTVGSVVELHPKMPACADRNVREPIANSPWTTTYGEPVDPACAIFNFEIPFDPAIIEEPTVQVSKPVKVPALS